jgi:dTDP-4-amino-4,6-dideoxygalactose transaminase
MGIPLVNLQRMHAALRSELDEAISSTVDAGDFVLGSAVSTFEREFADYCGAQHCIAVGSGLDALTFALKAAGVGRDDEVIVPANTFVATALAVVHCGATPVLIDHDPDTYNLDANSLELALSSRTRAIVPVHLYGRAANMSPILDFAERHDLRVIEDAAQAHGATWLGRRCGAIGDAGAFSFYPGKNLGALGDGGAVVTNNEQWADWLRQYRNYGSARKYHHDICGTNSRLDNIQAAVLRVKLRHLDRWNQQRRTLAARYRAQLTGTQDVALPCDRDDARHALHLFVIRTPHRDSLLAALNQSGIGAGIHYPIPIHRQPGMAGRFRIVGDLTHTERGSRELLSLPLCPYIGADEVDFIAGQAAEHMSGPTPDQPSESRSDNDCDILSFNK